uniref:Putative intracellular signal transduction n=1 Tax=Lutzomyia longipalpis TaxID=7200 RepID=A0A7G3AMM5_LUTLO
MGILKVLGNSFSATALFLLGLRMVGKAHKLQGPGFLIPGILILVKLLVLPIVIRQTVNIMDAGANFTDTTDLGTFGFLYGTFPAAPGVFVIASQYNTEVDLVASSMVACTFISAPLMIISAKMITLTNLSPTKYLSELVLVAFDISISAIIACLWLLLLFSVTKKIRRMPHKITSCLVLSQLIGSVGVLMWSLWETSPNWLMYLQFSLFTIGTYSSRLWCACLAVTLLFLQCRSLCFVLKLWPVFVGIAWGLPTLIVSFLLIFDSNHIRPSERKNPSFQYGNAQAAIAVFLLVMCFIVTVGCLVLHQRYKKRFEKYMTLSKEISTGENRDEEDLSTSTSNLIQSETDLTSRASSFAQDGGENEPEIVIQVMDVAHNPPQQCWILKILSRGVLRSNRMGCVVLNLIAPGRRGSPARRSFSDIRRTRGGALSHLNSMRVLMIIKHSSTRCSLFFSCARCLWVWRCPFGHSSWRECREFT